MSFTDLIAAHRQLTAGLRHDGSRRAWGLACPGDEPWHGLGDSPAVAPPPGGVLIGLLEELSAWGVRVRGMTITRLQGTLMLADGRAVVPFCAPRRRACWRVTSSPWTRFSSSACTCCS